MTIEQYEIKNRFSEGIQFVAEIDVDEDTTINVKIGLAVKWARENGANLCGVDLSDADLHCIDLSGTKLIGANLHNADLSDANLHRANLLGTDLSGANLSDADLSDAYLCDVDLSDVNLTDANLLGTDLRGAKR